MDVGVTDSMKDGFYACDLYPPKNVELNDKFFEWNTIEKLDKTTKAKICLFDSLFYHYGEYENYYQRLKYFNYKLAIVPNSRIYHDRGDRIIKKDNSQNFKFRSLLLELSDINKTDIYVTKRFKYLKKLQKRAMLVDLLKGRWTKIREAHLYFQFFN